MMRPLRLISAAALTVIATTAVATAQTVIVRKATPGAAVEVIVNAKPVGSGTVDAAGDVRVPFSLQAATGKNEIDANVFLDVCEKRYRVVIAEKGQPIAAEEQSCDRRSVSGLFLVRRVTSLVVNVDSQIPALLLIQGSYSLEPKGPPRTWRDAPTGLVVFGGAGMARFSNAVARACGDVTTCSGDSSWGALTAGANYWLAPFLAAEVTYTKPMQLDITGEGNDFTFTSFTDAYVLSVGAKVGLPVRALRFYGQIGATYHEATSATTQTMEDRTITVDGVERTIEGGTQAFEMKTAGGGWGLGGGVEAWVTQRFAIFGEAGRWSLRGDAKDRDEGEMDDALTTAMFGIRLRIWR